MCLKISPAKWPSFCPGEMSLILSVYHQSAHWDLVMLLHIGHWHRKELIQPRIFDIHLNPKSHENDHEYIIQRSIFSNLHVSAKWIFMLNTLESSYRYVITTSAQYIISYHIISWYHIISYHIRVQYIILYHIIYHIISYIISYHILPHLTLTSPHPTPPLISPHDAMRYDTIQYKTEQYNTIKYLSQRPHPRAKTWHKIWMIGLHPNHDTIPILSLQNSQSKCQKSLSTYDHRRHLILALPQVHPSPLWMHAPVAKEHRLMTSQYPIFDHTDNLNPRWMPAVNG